MAQRFLNIQDKFLSFPLYETATYTQKVLTC